ncbi:MAG: hypothetical protein J6C96_03910 [Oscillospiraceae bacterium]|nr:hypothetical protein [Oscillospiraceae bacterium]
MKHIGLFILDSKPEVYHEPGLESLTISQLRNLAAEDGIDLGKAKTKAEIIAAFNEAMG